MTLNQKSIKDAVKSHFSELADRPDDIKPFFPAGTTIAETLYSPDYLENLPDRIIQSSSGCGNPIAFARLKPGETVLDLGSGGGIDCFIAARAVGSSGHVIGVDMTDKMLDLARKNKAELGLMNVEFRIGEIEDLPLESNTINVVISNCVINLSPDKDSVFREAFRVLKPGGHFTVCDIVTEGDIPERLRANINALVSSIIAPVDYTKFGPIDKTEYLEKLHQTGFTNMRVEILNSYGIEVLNTLDRETREALSNGVDWSTIPSDVRYCSVNIIAYKPLF